MQLHYPTLMRFVLAGVMSLSLGVAGFAQPKAEKSPEATAPDSTAATTQSAQPVASPGVLVAGVQAGSPAEKAGIVRGDIILEAKGTAVNTPANIQKILDAGKPGDSLALKIRHGDTEKTVSATLTDQAGQAWLGIVVYPDGRRMGRGFGNGRGYGLAVPAAGAYVAKVVAGSPAEKAGLKEGDVILSVDGTSLDAQHVLGDMIAAKKVGDAVTLSVQSGAQAQPRDVKVTLAKNPSKDAPYLGIEYTMAQPRFGFSLPDQGVVQGVLVAEVTADGPAAKAGVTTGDVITKVGGIAVTDPQQVVDAVGKHKPGDSLLLTVYSNADAKERDITVTLGQSPSDSARALLGVSMSPSFGFRGGRMPFGMPFGDMPRNRPAPPASSAPSATSPTI